MEYSLLSCLFVQFYRQYITEIHGHLCKIPTLSTRNPKKDKNPQAYEEVNAYSTFSFWLFKGNKLAVVCIADLKYLSAIDYTLYVEPGNLQRSSSLYEA